MNKFILLTSIYNQRVFGLNTKYIHRFGTNDSGQTMIIDKDGEEYKVEETIDQIWEMLKPSIIFA